jgi:hypothetical protein
MLASFSVREVTGYAGENVSNESEFLLIGVPCEVVNCDVLAFKTEKGMNCSYLLSISFIILSPNP